MEVHERNVARENCLGLQSPAPLGRYPRASLAPVPARLLSPLPHHSRRPESVRRRIENVGQFVCEIIVWEW